MDKTVTLQNSIKMPLLGLGTWKMPDDNSTVEAIQTAIQIGYRLIDTATMYGNEKSVGKAVRECGIPREQLFVTTKLFPTDFFNPEKAFHTSLEKLDIGYIDLYLIHWPAPVMPKSIWQTLEKVYGEKLTRAIGVSNYGVSDLEKLARYASVAPMVNQIEFNPFSFDRETLEYCRERNIAVESYSPLTRGSHLHDQAIEKIAQKHGKSPAQIMIRWCLEQGTVVIPKASKPEHMRENSEVFDFELDSADMATLSTLS